MESTFAFVFDELLEEIEASNTKEFDSLKGNYKQIPILSEPSKSRKQPSHKQKPKYSQRKAFDSIKTPAFIIGALLTQSVRTFSFTMFKLIRKGKSRPTRGYVADLAVNIIRQCMQFNFVKLSLLRKGMSLIKTPKPKGVSVIEFDLEINRNMLLQFEKQGAEYLSNSKLHSIYSIPGEICESTKGELYHINCSWMLPWNVTFDGLMKQKSRNNTARKIILYIHGGAYILGNSKIYTSFTGRLAKETNAVIIVPNYRLAPESPFPCALHDVFATYMWLIDPMNPMFGIQDHGDIHDPFDPKDIILAGDSAGGGLAIALVHYLNIFCRNPDGSHLVPLPCGAFVLSPWVDLQCSAKSYIENKEYDILPFKVSSLHSPITDSVQHPVYSYCFGETFDRKWDLRTPKSPKFPNVPFNRANSATMLNKLSHISFTEIDKDMLDHQDSDSDNYRDKIERFVRHPLVSPIYGDFHGFPPLLIQAGSCEVLRDESIALAYKYLEQNGDSTTSWVRHELYTDMFHVFQAAVHMEASKVAMKRIVKFVKQLFYEKSYYDSTLNAEESKFMHMIDSHRKL